MPTGRAARRKHLDREVGSRMRLHPGGEWVMAGAGDGDLVDEYRQQKNSGAGR
ncbi:MAG: hypothetical protein OXF74_09060 [Rhodobacteraceae bacterium]|nr:hypothetical protein [Paracoccaceae bacterium]